MSRRLHWRNIVETAARCVGILRIEGICVFGWLVMHGKELGSLWGISLNRSQVHGARVLAVGLVRLLLPLFIFELSLLLKVVGHRLLSRMH